MQPRLGAKNAKAEAPAQRVITSIIQLGSRKVERDSSLCIVEEEFPPLAHSPVLSLASSKTAAGSRLEGEECAGVESSAALHSSIHLVLILCRTCHAIETALAPPVPASMVPCPAGHMWREDECQKALWKHYASLSAN